jgi:hypothetical protein
MSDTLRNKVVLVSQCEAWLAVAQSKLNEATEKVRRHESELASIKSESENRLRAIREKIESVRQTIKAVLSQDGDATSLEKKEKEYQNALSEESGRPALLEAIQKHEAEIEAGKKEMLAASAEVDEKTKLLNVAWDLKRFYDLDNKAGILDAPEYETKEEAVQDYLKSVRVDFGISESVRVDHVVIWQVPYANKPTVLSVAASPDLGYILNAIPLSLSWLQRFPAYANRPVASFEDFERGGSKFHLIPKSGDFKEEVADDSEDGESQEVEVSDGDDVDQEDEEDTAPEWVGDYEPPSESSLYSPGADIDHRSGLCFIKSEDRFYAISPDEIKSVQKVWKKEQKQVRSPSGYGRVWAEVEVEGVEHGEYDASALIHELYEHVFDAKEAVESELSNLRQAKTPLAMRIRSLIELVAGTETQFVKEARRLDGAEINELVGPYWDAFVSAPWEPGISENCAMLKHLCERKLEMPHVYSYGVKGHYGLKVRTRDHDWIEASLYCPPANLAPKGPVSHDAVAYLRSDGVCTRRVMIGPCCLSIGNRVK